MTRIEILRARQRSSSYGPALTWLERLELDRSIASESPTLLLNQQGSASLPVRPLSEPLTLIDESTSSRDPRDF